MKYKKQPLGTFVDQQEKLYPGIVIKNITLQVTEDCCLNCSYCYQHHKTKKKMTFETAKLFIDKLLNNEISDITTENTGGIVLDFIGGEPLMEIKLITNIWEYFISSIIKYSHPWKNHIRGSLCTNGILYFQDDVQNFLRKYGKMFSITISIDGNKELHDSCRKDFAGNGSYDRAIQAVHHYRKHYDQTLATKMTLSPENVTYTFDAIRNLIHEGYDDILLNCVYEKGWTWKHAKILYNELVKISDYLIDNNLYDKIYLSIFEENFFIPMDEEDNENWCGGVNNKMLALDPEGNYFTCIRYMESSLNGKQKPLKIGSNNEGYLTTEEYQNTNQMLTNITRRSQSTDECFYCPVAKGCAWCSALNYEEFGTVNKRTTYICVMHKARALANCYYWNKLYQKLNINKIFINYLSDEDINKILGGEEND